MDTTPVILLAFANDRVEDTRYLRNLPTELRQITHALEPAVEAGLCELVTLANATLSQIIDTFQKKRYQDRIAIFHYGGHADGYQLLLESEAGKHDIAHGAGLVSFFKNQKGLQLVFLNGCSTEQQSLELSEAGVPVVIGTSSSIADEVATQLATRFYSSLGNGSSIERSWREAKDEISIRKGAGINRDLVIRFDEQNTVPDSFPWRFIVKKGAELANDWNLPDASQNPLFGLPQPPRRDLPEEPFRFLKWYGEEHAELFFGRGRYIRELYERITDPDGSPLLLLYGRSGVGKSSILDAGLLPRLRDRCEVVYLRRSGALPLVDTLRGQLSPQTGDDAKPDDWASEIRRLEDLAAHTAQPLIKAQLFQLIRSLQAQKQKAASEQAASSTKGSWLERENQSGKPLVIILDQVEEIYTQPSSLGSRELVDLLEEVRQIFADIDDRPKGKIILSYRKEYHPEIAGACLEQQIPKEQVFLQPLQRSDIVEVVRGLTSTDRLRKKYGLQIDELLPGVVADDLISDENSAIAPILQILLTKMWQLAAENDRPVFSLENYNRLRKEGILLDDFFDQQIQKLNLWNPEPEASGLAIDLLNFHTTDLGTAHTRSLEEISSRYQHRQEILDTLLAKFKELYLLAESGKGGTRLAHDTLAPLVQNEFKQSDRPGQRALRILANKSAIYSLNPETVIDEEDLELVERGKTGMRLWVKKEEALIEKSRQRKAALEAERRRNRRFKRTAVAALALFAVVVSWLGYNARQEARAGALIASALEAEKTDATVALRLAERALAIRPNNLSIRQTLGNIFGDNEFYQQWYEHSASVRSLALSPDGQLLLSGDTAGRLWRRDRTGALIDSAIIHEGGVNAIAFSPDGLYYATGGEDNTIKIWDRQAALLQTLEGHEGAVAGLAFSPDGKHLLSGSRDSQARLWDWETGTLDTVLAGHEGIVYAVAFSPDNRLIVTGGEDGAAKIWTRNGGLIATLSDHQDRVLCAAFSPDSRYILTGSRDKTAILWDSAGTKRRQLLGHTARINAVRFSPNGESLFSAGDDRIVLQWDSAGHQIARYAGHSNYVNDLAISEDGALLFTGSEDRSVKKWLPGSKLQRELHHFDQPSPSPGYSYGIGAAVFSPGGQSLVTAGYKAYLDPIEEMFDMDDKSQTIRIWDLATNETVDLSGHTDGIRSIAFSPDGEGLLSGSRDGTARLWAVGSAAKDKPEGKIISRQEGEVSAVAYSPEGSFFVTAGQDSLCRRWSPQGDSISSVRHGAWITAVAVSPDGKQFATGGMDQKVRIWAAGSPAEATLILEGHRAAVIALAYSPDGKYLAGGGEDNVLNVWDRRGNLVFTKQELGNNLSGIGAIRSIAFSKDGKTLVIGGEDGTARVLDLQGNTLQTITASIKGIASVGFSPDGQSILTAGDDGAARLNFNLEAYLRSERAAQLPEEAEE